MDNKPLNINHRATELGSAALPSGGILRGEEEGIVPRKIMEINNGDKRSGLSTLIDMRVSSAFCGAGEGIGRDSVGF
jgi:hypothetical protein